MADQPLVDAEWLAAHLNDPDLRVIEVDVSGESYADGHVPGAVLWNAYGDLRGGDYLPIDDARLEALLSRSGIGPETTVLLCGYAAHLGYWLLSSRGHRSLRLLDGPRDGWHTGAWDWSTEAPAPEPTSYTLAAPDPGLSATRADLERLSAEGAVILDVRSAAEYEGERFWLSGATADAGRAGHIPGAVSVPIDRLRADQRFHDPEQMRRGLEQAGVGPGEEIVTYCTIANRASQAWFAMTQVLGYPSVRVYYPSWVEWGKRDDTPVEA
jgi:thiosulfate/3-mercaptopyruvate sulfurtransferase